MGLTLRPYQERCIELARGAVRDGQRRVLIVLPTGAGKSAIGSSIATRHLEAGGTGVLWLAHRKELVGQAAAGLSGAGVIAAGVPETASRIQVASVQTLRRRVLPPASLIVADEAHHYAASNEWTELLRSYPDAVCVGLTATPERGDGQGLGDVFDGLVQAASVRELTALGHLVPCEVIAPASVLRSGEIAQRPVDALLQHARGRKAVCFSPHVRAAKQHLEEFLAAGLRAGLVHGELGAVERSSIVTRYRAGELDVLVNVYVLTEGFDDPATEVCILARGCGTTGTYLQMVGRVLRPSPGKQTALLLDLRGVVHVHGRPDDDRLWSLTGRAVGRASEQFGALCTVCGAPLAGATVCPDCGRSPAEMEPPRVTGAALLKFATIRRDTDEQKAARLARWIAEARAKGWKEGHAMFRFKGAYGAHAPRHVVDEARRLARGSL